VSGLEGTSLLVRLALRRDRVRLPVWVVALLGVTWLSADAMGTTFPTQRSIDAYAASVAASPAVIAMSGPPIALDTLAGIVINKIAFTSILGVALLTVLTVVRHTRAEEEEGRSELLRATVVGRYSGGTAALAVATLVAMAVGVGTALALVAVDVPASGSWLFGMSVTAVGVFFAAVALVAAQVFTHARTALGVTLAVLGAAYLVRAAGDVREDFLVWVSPIGWSQATHPLGDERWWPLVLSAAASVLLVLGAVWLSDRRDVGAGIVAPRDGAGSASPLLSGPVGLAFRLQRGALIGWAAGLFVLSAAVGSLSRAVEDMAEGNPVLSDYLAATGEGSLTDTYFSTMLLILALLSSAFAVSSALRLRSEETSGRLESLLATGLSRTRWLLGSLVATLAGTVALLVVSGLGLGLTYGLVISDATQPLRMAALTVVYAPAALAPAALAVLLIGWLPRAVAVAWLVLGYCLVLGWLGGLLSPPRWVDALSPFWHTPAVPVESVELGGPAVIAVGAVLLVAFGCWGIRRRDIG
jgi:ABC-2 type transport system permease protein